MSYINKFKACTRCKSKDTIQTIYQVGETVCKNCGLVYEERVIVDEDKKKNLLMITEIIKSIE
jgi:translation initiation factor 2 beta subunit (eIF-2beta)/eIF-5